MQTVKFILDNVESVLAIIAGVQIAAVAIVKLTPTPKDDAFLAKVLPWVEKLAGFLSVRAKSKPAAK